MASLVAAPVLNQVITIPPLKEKATKTTVQVELQGGTITLQPRCKVEGASLLDTGDLAGIEYAARNASATKLTADITASGVYDFLTECVDLVLTVTAINIGGGQPRIHYSQAVA